MTAPGKGDGPVDPAEEARLLEEAEDQMDIEEALKRLVDGQDALPYESVRRQLGLR